MQALTEMSEYNHMNDTANRKLLSHAHEQHQIDLKEHDARISNLHSFISMHLRQKVILQRELALAKHRMEEDACVDMMNTSEKLEDVKLFMAILGVLAVLMALAFDKHEWFFLITPAYFVVVLLNLA